MKSVSPKLYSNNEMGEGRLQAVWQLRRKIFFPNLNVRLFNVSDCMCLLGVHLALARTSKNGI